MSKHNLFADICSSLHCLPCNCHGVWTWFVFINKVIIPPIPNTMSQKAAESAILDRRLSPPRGRARPPVIRGSSMDRSERAGDRTGTVWRTWQRWPGQSMEWTGSIRWIHNPVQSRRILDWTGSRNVQCVSQILRFKAVFPYRNPDSWSSTLKSSAIYPRLYLRVDFTRYLADSYSFVSGLDWTGFSFWVTSWTGLD